jgi:catechol 2,3-dioxygenase-like lactoylglutathione lyase family enzyme
MAYTTTPVPGIRFDHIAIALPRMADAMAFVVGTLGGAPSFGMDSGPYRFGQWKFANGARLELLEPVGADGFLHRFLASRGSGIHHVTFKVPSLAEACQRAEARGYEIVGRNERNPYWREAFLHPRQALGIVIQLAQTARFEGKPPPWTDAPPMPASPPPPVSVLGLRMRAQSRERAVGQWRGILESEVADRDGTLVFTWPGSPMGIVVEIDPGADEGPLRVELASGRPVNLPAGPHPVLGATFSARPPASS